MGASGRIPQFDFVNYSGLASPNWTQIPDEFLDFMAAALSGSEVKVFLYILRRTFGFKREADRITFDQFVDGLQNSDGEYLDYGTGLSRRAVIDATKSLEEKGLIEVVRSAHIDGGSEVNLYRVRMAGGGGAKIAPPPGCKNCTPRGAKIAPPRETAVRKTEQQQQDIINNINIPRGTLFESPEDAIKTPVVVAFENSSTSETTTENDPQLETIRQHLTTLGVAGSTAKSLLRKYEPDLIYRWLCYTEHRLANGWVPRESPAAWCVTAIRSGDWVIPDWFQTPEEQAVANAVQDQTTRAEQLQRVEQTRQDQQEAEAQRQAMEQKLEIGEQTRQQWEQVKILLQERDEFSIAFYTAFLLPLNGAIATIVTPVQFFCGTIEKHAEALRVALAEVSGRTVDKIVVQHMALPVPDTVEQVAQIRDA